MHCRNGLARGSPITGNRGRLWPLDRRLLSRGGRGGLSGWADRRLGSDWAGRWHLSARRHRRGHGLRRGFPRVLWRTLHRLVRVRAVLGWLFGKEIGDRLTLGGGMSGNICRDWLWLLDSLNRCFALHSWARRPLRHGSGRSIFVRLFGHSNRLQSLLVRIKVLTTYGLLFWLGWLGLVCLCGRYLDHLVARGRQRLRHGRFRCVCGDSTGRSLVWRRLGWNRPLRLRRRRVPV